MRPLITRTRALLRWSERYTKTDMVYLASGGGWLSLEYAIQMVFGTIIAIAFANLLPKEAFGTYQFVLAAAAILGAFTLAGMGLALSRTVAQGNPGALHHAFRTKLVWNVGIALAGGLLALYYYFQGDDTLALSFLYIGALAPFLEAFKLYQSFLLGLQRFRESVFFGVWRRPIPVVLLVVALFFTDDPATLVLVYFASHTLSTGLLYFAMVREFKPGDTPDPGMIAYSKHLSVMTLFERLGSYADKVLVFALLGPASVAIYSLALFPIEYMRTALTKLRAILLPKLATRDYAVLQGTLPRKITLALLAAALLVLAYILAVPFLFKLIFPLYPEAVIVSQVLVLSLLVLPLAIYRDAFLAHEKKLPLYISQIGTPVLKIALLFVLIPLFGIWGAVGAYIVAELAASVVGVLFFRFLRA